MVSNLHIDNLCTLECLKQSLFEKQVTRFDMISITSPDDMMCAVEI